MFHSTSTTQRKHNASHKNQLKVTESTFFWFDFFLSSNVFYVCVFYSTKELEDNKIVNITQKYLKNFSKFRLSQKNEFVSRYSSWNKIGFKKKFFFSLSWKISYLNVGYVRLYVLWEASFTYLCLNFLQVNNLWHKKTRLFYSYSLSLHSVAMPRFSFQLHHIASLEHNYNH